MPTELAGWVAFHAGHREWLSVSFPGIRDIDGRWVWTVRVLMPRLRPWVGKIKVRFG